MSATRPTPPTATRDESFIVEQLGRTRADPYAWLKDENWREVMRDPSQLKSDIRAYLEAENAWTQTHLDTPTQALQNTLFDEMKARLKEDESSVPALDGPWAYYRRYREGGEYPIVARKPAAIAFEKGEAEEQILLDGDALGKGHDYFDMRAIAHSPDHALIAYTIDDKGSEFYTLRIRDTKTGKDIEEFIPDTYGDFVWGEDSISIYWIARDESARPVSVYCRKLGTGKDTLIYREEDPGFFIGVQKSASNRFIFITANDHTTSEWRFFPADTESPDPQLIAPREAGVDYAVTEFDGRFWIRTNANKAVDFSLVSAPIENPGRANWTTEVPHRSGTLILDVEPFADFLVRLERENGTPRIIVRARVSGEEHSINFEDAAYSLAMLDSYEWETTQLRYQYASPTTPAQVFDYDMATRERVLRKEQEVPSGHNPDDYITERLDAPASDGTTIPITLLRHKNTPVDATAPVLLYGYGAYGITIPADFRTARLSLVDRGFIYASVDTRGSMAKGYQWYLDGKLEKKTNTFTDFVTAGRFLSDKGYTSPGKIVGMGGSAGGMLMGAVANLDPELFAGIIAAVPFVDVLNTMSDETLPLTPPEWPEWGNPIADEAAYDTIAAYSPYDQVTDRPYPPILITGGLTDPRVTYWEPAKWAARLRHDAPDAGPYFLRINMDAGHAGVSGRFASLRETALEFAFALAVTGKADDFHLKP